MPAGGQRTGFRFSIPHAGECDQIWVVEHRSACVGEHVAQFAALMDRALRFGRAVAADVAREGQHLEKALKPRFVEGDVGVALAVAAFDVYRPAHARCATPWARHVKHVEVLAVDQPVGVGPDERLPWTRPPVPQQAVFDVLRLQRFPQQCVVLQVDHSCCQVVGGAPVAADALEFRIRRWLHLLGRRLMGGHRQGRPNRRGRGDFRHGPRSGKKSTSA